MASTNVYSSQIYRKLQSLILDFFCVPFQNGLMVAVGQGYVDIVAMLHKCPFIDINHQDNDGNTALMIAAQAGVCEDTLYSTKHNK